MKVNSQIKKLIDLELKRQQDHVELIASENYVSEAILAITGSILTNKYAEGYPFHRYYGGCEYVDQVEQLAIDKVKELFQAEHANVQSHSGSQANAAAYYALLQPRDTILAMDLAAGGHLTHGYNVNFSGRLYDFHSYQVDPTTEMLDYDAIEKIAIEAKPKLIVAGASAYSREIDFKKFRAIADKVGALLMVDMAHIAGLIAAGLHQSPIPYADVVTSTTHKTLRGPRGGLILSKQKWAKKINSAVFPGNQGGPLEHVIAAKAQCFLEALQPDFKAYEAEIINNAKALAATLKANNLRLVADGTDNHLLMVDVKSSLGISGQMAEEILQKIGIICNKNMIPFDKESSMVTSGIRLGTAAMTTRGFGNKEFKHIGEIIYNVLKEPTENNIVKYQKEVKTLLNDFPIYSTWKLQE
ncbi:serine hydroxymethyltransferase [Spiroplasma citri]|uniref:Serine hydroxymethyltransferase n=1 Tax=Spiroplasma citri TaxID=2133 RepID=Q14KZ7_SPICI|nr:serine hydroxymethyltransferase [Spiroplasma citri]APE75706.1 serine hydroxymethyltransferase [Spiroplasma citri]QED25484.1 serine hydroxymethyltransferase [Spiroplasma citri]QIA67875.1 aminotransferase class I/II-fold pyridoxal phosphate-dependent enzyme [Spiroplasma citri]QIA69729.1 aminotransferase class I/II-fold pyridoxal phosphate-dependent enzyme [Spiroplasma citri]QIA71601.1 aminotransferase class I/II-fold pyridoxal phosphate-dependent enzyme [Spiroplasma citri]